MRKSVKVSIITPVYNSENFLELTLNCVISQEYTNWEMLIVDDKSTDDSIKIIEKYARKDTRIKLIRLKKNSGAAIARNVALKNAKGNFIAFLDSDDLWEKDKLEKQINFMLEHNYYFTYTFYSVISENGEPISKNLYFPSKVSYNDLLKTCSIGCLTVIINKEFFCDISMPLIKKGQDYALWLKLLKQVNYAYCYEEVLARYRIVNNSLSRNKFYKLKSQWNIYSNLEKLPLHKSLYYVIHYLYNGIKKNLP